MRDNAIEQNNQNTMSDTVTIKHVAFPDKCYSHRGSTGPAEPLLRTTTTTNMAAANFVVKTCNN